MLELLVTISKFVLLFSAPFLIAFPFFLIAKIFYIVKAILQKKQYTKWDFWAFKPSKGDGTKALIEFIPIIFLCSIIFMSSEGVGIQEMIEYYEAATKMNKFLFSLFGISYVYIAVSWFELIEWIFEGFKQEKEAELQKLKKECEAEQERLNNRGR